MPKHRRGRSRTRRLVHSSIGFVPERFDDNNDADDSKAAQRWSHRRASLAKTTISILATLVGCSLLLMQQARRLEAPPQGRMRASALVAAADDQPPEHSPKTCSIWMAPSSLVGHAGFGIYTTRAFAAQESLLARPNGPSIPVVDPQHGPAEPHGSRSQWIRTFDDYWWGRGVPDHVFYEGDSVLDYQITFGALPNHHCLLDAIDHRYPPHVYHDGGAHRLSGAGAVSYARGRDFYATRPVAAGEELFLNYKHCQRSDTAPTEDWTDTKLLTMPVDYEEAADLVWQQGQSLLTQPPRKRQAPETRLQWSPHLNKHVQALLPPTVGALTDLLAGVARTALPSHLARQRGTTPRTVAWIKGHGLCLEHIVPGPSRLSHAGQGAIAQHAMGPNDMVVPAPLLHIVDRDVLTMYDAEHQPTGRTQLLLNYCLGRADIPLLLCPNTNAILINHCSIRRPTPACPKGPNAAFRWAGDWDSSSKEWERMTIDEIAAQKGRGLAMEVTALRHIEPGEEIFVDYGLDWEDAWEEHVLHWKPPKETAERWITAEEVNDSAAIPASFVSGDLRRSTAHPHLFTGCQYWTTELDEHKAFTEAYVGWEKLPDAELLQTFADDGMAYEGDYAVHNDQLHWPCSVLTDNGDDTYVVRIHQSDWYSTQPWAENDVPRLLKNYPRQSIHFFVKPYMSDQNLPGAFRHPIGIPEDMVPPQWKTRKGR